MTTGAARDLAAQLYEQLQRLDLLRQVHQLLRDHGADPAVAATLRDVEAEIARSEAQVRELRLALGMAPRAGAVTGRSR